MKEDIAQRVQIPDGLTVSYEDGTFTVQGDNGSVQRELYRPKISVSVEDDAVVLSAEKASQREKRQMHTLRSHLKNLFKGASEGHTYRLKICSGHFPMNVSVSNGVLTVKNFLGEAVPRTLTLKEGADVSIDDDIITVTSTHKEVAGQQAADIEQLTRVTNKDRRIFQDGLFIIEKDGKKL